MNDDFRSPKGTVKPTPAETKTNLTGPEPAFVTPDEAAATDDLTTKASIVKQTTDAVKAKISNNPWWQWPPSKREYAIMVAVVVVLAGVLSLTVFHHKAKPKIVAKPVLSSAKAVTPKTVPSTLTGLPVDPSINSLPVTAVMVENSTDARPQSGLSQAGVVFEAIAEGGVTRFMALFQDSAPDNIGPIRSARPYYVQWALGFDASYAHVGGSPDALSDIKAWNVKDLNQFYNGSYYHRVSSRPAPHNVYTGIPTLNQLEAKKGFTSTFKGFARKTAAPAKTPTASTVNLTLSGALYNVQYNYVAASNSYNRSEGGAPHIDANNNQQIAPKVVIAIVVPLSRGALDASGAYYSNYNVLGTGPAYIFQDGVEATGTWSKADNATNLSFADANGLPLKLNPGQTWITAITDSGKVSYH